MVEEKLTGNFIGVFQNALDKDICKTIIEDFEKLDKAGLTHTRKETEDSASNFKDDKSIFTHTYVTTFSADTTKKSVDAIYKGLKLYVDKFATLTQDSDIGIFDVKVQRTIPTGGYHPWHQEFGNGMTKRRALAYILYLNDVEEGGETEFLYLSKRIKPEAGTLVIFPSSFTHAHRGNPPLSGTKYILTGWGEYTS